MRVIPLLFAAALALGGCASTPFPRRVPASAHILSPFGGGATGPGLVDAVIRRLGPARHQVDTPLCFAHAAADVATFHTGRRVSAFSVAVRNFQHRGGLDYVFFNPGGVIAGGAGGVSRYMLGLGSSALDSLLKGSLCAEDQPASDLTYRDENLRRLWDLYQNYYRPYIGPTEPTALYSGMRAEVLRIMPSLPAAEFPARVPAPKPLDLALGDWFDTACDIRMPAGKLKVRGSELAALGADGVVAALERALAGGEIAVIHYDAGVLHAEDPSFWQTVIGFHVSSIVARVETGGAKHFLLRNSWGARCDFYAPDIAARCDRGHIWLTEDEVRRYVTTVASFAPAD